MPRQMVLSLVAEALSIERGDRLVLEDIGFSVAAGEALLVTGPNGTGKTTLLRTIAGFLKPSSGSLHLLGGDPQHDLSQYCHYAGHLDAVKLRLTVAENLDFWAEYLGGQADKQREALAAFDLTDLADVTAGYLSAGQRRRLGLTRLLSADRSIWLLDEPTVSLDAASVALLLAAMSRHLAGDGMIVAATHVALQLPGARELRLGGGATALAAESAGL